MENGRCHHRRNQGVSLESSSFIVDQFYDSVVCMMREIEVVCIVNSCNYCLLLLVWTVVVVGCM